MQLQRNETVHIKRQMGQMCQVGESGEWRVIKVHVLHIPCCVSSFTWSSRALGSSRCQDTPPQRPAGRGLYGGKPLMTVPAALRLHWKKMEKHSFTRLSYSKKTVYMYTQYCPYSVFAYPDSCWLMSFDVTFMSLRHSKEVLLSLWSPSVHSNSNFSLSFREASALSTMGRSKWIGLL